MMRWSLPLLALALSLSAPEARAFDLLECDFDDFFGNAGATIGWASNAAAMGTWELDTSGAPGSFITSGNALHALGAAIAEWDAVTASTYSRPSTVAVDLFGADITDTETGANRGDRHIMMIIDSAVTRDGLNGWGAVKSTATTDSILGITRLIIDQETRHVIEADIYLNDDQVNGGPPLFQGIEGRITGGFSFHFQSVAAHEFGHALGADHTFRRSSTMATPAQNLTIEPVVDDDLNILRWLYPTSAVPIPPDRNSTFFVSCDEVGASGEVEIQSTAGGGCQLSPPRTATWPFALGLFLAVLGADARARRRRRG